MTPSAALVSVRHLAAVLLVLLIGRARLAGAGPVPRPLSQPLGSPDTYQAVQEVSKHAQRSETLDESSIRLLPDVSGMKDSMLLCCLHANILDFYLHNVFTHPHERHHKVQQLHDDLNRVGQDLKAHGCNILHYHDHQHAVAFKSRLAQMDRGRGINKALGEVDMLFSNLRDNCVSGAH